MRSIMVTNITLFYNVLCRTDEIQKVETVLFAKTHVLTSCRVNTLELVNNDASLLYMQDLLCLGKMDGSWMVH